MTSRTAPARTPARRLAATAGVIALTGSGIVVGGAASAGADPASVPAPVSVTTAGAFSGTVPDGVCAVRSVVTGAAGGHNMIGGGVSTANANGGGASITTTYSVVPGMAYAGTVGGGGRQAATVGNAGGGGSNGGGAGGTVSSGTHPGSGGGGWTDLRLGGTVVVLSGGGGGSSGGHSLNEGFGGNAGIPTGSGVTAGSDGLDGREPSGNRVGGGSGGTTAVGAGGVNAGDATRNGLPGSDRNGGAGAADPDPDSGGGGGGGWFGAGGGASTVSNGSAAPITDGIAGGGGGGGSSYVAASSPDGSGSSVASVSGSVGPRRATAGDGDDGSVTLTWVPCAYDLVIDKTGANSPTRIGSTITWTVTVTNRGDAAMTRGDLLTVRDSLPGNGATRISSIVASGGSNDLLARGAVTCDAAAGDPMPATLTCSRPYSAPSSPGAPSGGARGLDVGETLVVTYTQDAVRPEGTLTNTAGVIDRATGDVDTATASVDVTYAPPVANPDTATGPQGAPLSSPVLDDDTRGDLPLDASTLTLLDASGDPATEVAVPGEGTFTLDGSSVVFTPLPEFVGAATAVSYRVADSSGTTTTSTFTPTITRVLADATTDGPQGVPQPADVLAGTTVGVDPASLTLVDGTGTPVTSLTVPGEGTYTLRDGGVLFTPLPGFSGTATPVSFQVDTLDHHPVRARYTAVVSPVVPVSSADDTSGPQGVAQSVDPLTNDGAGHPDVPLDASSLTLLDADGDPVPFVTVTGAGTYSIDAGRIVFTPEPTHTGTVLPVAYRVADVNGTTTSSTYTPTFVAVSPSAEGDSSSGPQGAAQSVDPLVNDHAGDPDVPLDPRTLVLLDGAGDPSPTVTVAGQGTYSVGAGRIVFTPVPTFVGTADPVTYRVADVNGTTTTSTSTPTVRPVARPDASSGPQGVAQDVDPLANDTLESEVTLVPSTVRLVDPVTGADTAAVTVAGQGTYSVSAGRIVFTPLAAFTGVATPVGYRADDAAGHTVQSTYTPTLVGVEPGPAPDVTSGAQGQAQSVDPLGNDNPGDPGVPLDPATLTLLDADGDPASSVTITGQGTYTVSGGRIVFTPLAAFTGTADPVGYRVADTNGTTASSTYTPTVTPVRPTAAADSSRGLQGRPQSVDPLVNDAAGHPSVPLDAASLELLDADGDPATSVTITGQGTYTVSGGRIVLTPLPAFTGTADPVTYRVADTNGTTTTSTYTPTIDPTGPTAAPDATSGAKGAVQSVDPFVNDLPGDPTVPLDRSSLTLLDGDGHPMASVTVPGQGTYTVRDGRIVFTPLAAFTGTTDPVSYRIADVNGTTTTSTYTPTVLTGPTQDVGKVVERAPVGSTVVLDPSDDVPGLVPSSVRLVGPDGAPVTTLVVPDQGTWTVDTTTGLVTFVPEKGFTGDPDPVPFTGVTADGDPVSGQLVVDYYQAVPPLAQTGAALGAMAALALLLVVGGGVLVGLGRRRHAPRHA